MNDEKKVLIIDDEKELTDVLSDKLSATGIKTFTAHDGEEGYATALRERPDLILLDLIMPKQDGFETLKILRQDEWGKDAKVILLTVLDDVESISKAVEAKGYEYLIKTDWSLDDIVTKVQDALQKTQ